MKLAKLLNVLVFALLFMKETAHSAWLWWTLSLIAFGTSALTSHLIDLHQQKTYGKRRTSPARAISLLLLITGGMSLLGGPHFHR